MIKQIKLLDKYTDKIILTFRSSHKFALACHMGIDNGRWKGEKHVHTGPKPDHRNGKVTF